MQITQIQGPSIGQSSQMLAPNTQVSLPVPGAVIPYVESQNGQKILVPQGNMNVAVNGQAISGPTAINHGDSISIEHPNQPNPTILAVHSPDQKLAREHIGDFVRRAGLNLKDEQVLAIVKEIEQVERQKFILTLAAFAGVILVLIVGIGILWYLLGAKATLSETESLQKKMNSIQKELSSLSQKKSDKKEVTPEEIDAMKEKITELETKIADAESQKAQLDEATKKQIDDITKKFQTYSDELSSSGDFNERVKKFEEMLKSTDTGKTLESAQYYTDLQNKCNGSECCLNSVKIMMENSYKLADNNQCSVGEKVNRLKCMDSYVWCMQDGGQQTSTESPSGNQVLPVAN